MAVSISGNGTLTGITPEAGSVIQVVHGSSQTNTYSAGGASNAVDCVAVTITPKRTNSMMVIMYHATVVGMGDYPFASWIERNGTVVGVESTSTNTYASIATSAGSAAAYSDADAPDTVSGHCTDFPNTTANTTYTVRVGTRRDTAFPFRLAYAQNYGSNLADDTGWKLAATHKITVMEIAQ